MESFRVTIGNAGVGAKAEQAKAEFRRDVPPLVSLVLYLRSDAAEIRDVQHSTRVPGPPPPVKTKKGLQTYVPDGPIHWEAGYQLRAACGGPSRQTNPKKIAVNQPARPASPHRKCKAHGLTFGEGPRN